ncbi:uroporphyrinogen-III synthase [Spiribacter aquaticus]|uniref:Uroporphyrinogen-III synthase n=1 Tax=Spiribacter aquaticus TaxID=1935996 RepID=A0A557RMC9_9GAMM|nr:MULTISPECIES: uroporphyrinogen-III synthase [Spiribacter]KAF0279380.1 hypothetical protein BA897_01320 [Spiribacter roseus]TVO66333.1 uroporphyrinogen-III synthase [Spiribacter aquaticus]
MTTADALAGRRILVTRPEGQADGLIHCLEAAGAAVLHRPTLQIVALAPALPAIPRVDWLVFTSPNAVRHGVGRLPTERRGDARVAAVGPGTATAARRQGLAVSAAPQSGGGADDLLAEAAFDAGAGARVLIIRGEGGRRRLPEALRERGATVDEWVVYRREVPSGGLAIPREWQARPLDCTIVTSTSGLSGLLGMAGSGALEWLQKSRLVTVSERIAMAAVRAGWDAPGIAAGADDQAITRAVCAALQRESDEQDRQGRTEGPRDDPGR